MIAISSSRRRRKRAALLQAERAPRDLVASQLLEAVQCTQRVVIIVKNGDLHGDGAPNVPPDGSAQLQMMKLVPPLDGRRSTCKIAAADFNE